MECDGRGLQLRVAHVDEDDHVRLLGRLGQTVVVEAVAERHGGRLVDELEAVEARNGGRVEERSTLRIGHARGHGDDAVDHFRVQIHLGYRLELGEEHGRDLLARERARLVHVVHVDEYLLGGVRRLADAQRLIAALVLHLRIGELAREQALEAADCVLAVGDLLLLGRVALEALVVRERHICSFHGLMQTTTKCTCVFELLVELESLIVDSRLDIYGVIRSEYSLATISIPPARAIPTELLKFPISKPTTDMFDSFSLKLCAANYRMQNEQSKDQKKENKSGHRTLLLMIISGVDLVIDNCVKAILGLSAISIFLSKIHT